MKDASRSQGLAICAAAVALGLVFGIGLLSGAWWAVAIPVAVLLAFVLGLTFWVGYTLATVAIEPEAEAPTPRPPAAQAAPAPGEGRRDEGGSAGA
jgi:hypothetical protein